MQGVKALQGILETFAKGGGFDRHISRVTVIAGGNGSLTGVMKVEKEDSNRGGFLHGGMTAFLVDVLSTGALMTHPKSPPPGVSVNINLSYMKAAPIGEEILIKASTDKVGGRLAFLSVNIFNKKTGDIVATASHTKFIG